MTLLERYAEVAGRDVVEHLRQLAGLLKGARVVHVNATATGGGVAEILAPLIPLSRELGLDARWEVLDGTPEFFACTKLMHNAIQGKRAAPDEQALRAYEEVNAGNAARLTGVLNDAEFVFVHDPQPAALIRHFSKRSGHWIWRCHIDASHPDSRVWRYLQTHVAGYDASVFSLPAFVRALPHRSYVIPPAIDPLGDKNRDLPDEQVRSICERNGLDMNRPRIVQISRFDWFKDPLGVIAAYRIAKPFLPELQLLLAGGGASDDPEGVEVLRAVREEAGDDPDIHVADLPPGDNVTVNALQRGADIVVQKSLREGFGLTVAEGFWKGRPVIGGDTGGIRLQVVDHHTGFLVASAEGAALRIRYLLHDDARRQRMGEKAREFARRSFLLTRQLREYLTLMVALQRGAEERIGAD
ncbi:MAG: glycosyltransferase [Ectothiorhodospiraceae bacterium]|nr:glycosyltransferase [Ectothiorhodospiraceae bacterium]